MILMILCLMILNFVCFFFSFLFSLVRMVAVDHRKTALIYRAAYYFGPWVYPKGSLVIALVRVCVCVRVSVGDCSLVFSIFFA